MLRAVKKPVLIPIVAEIMLISIAEKWSLIKRRQKQLFCFPDMQCHLFHSQTSKVDFHIARESIVLT